MLTAVFDRVIDAVAIDPDVSGSSPADDDADPATELRHLVQAYAVAVSSRRRLMAVFIREVHHLPPRTANCWSNGSGCWSGEWRTLLAQAQPEWDAERVRTAVHGAFGMLNAVGTFASPLTDRELAGAAQRAGAGRPAVARIA